MSSNIGQGDVSTIGLLGDKKPEELQGVKKISSLPSFIWVFVWVLCQEYPGTPGTAQLLLLLPPLLLLHYPTTTTTVTVTATPDQYPMIPLIRRQLVVQLVVRFNSNLLVI